MSRFLPRHLSGGSLDGSNYALAHRQPLDLGLVSGPCPWDDVLRSVLSDVDHREWAGYRSPGTSAELVEAISAREGVSCDSVWITAGVDMAIEYVLGRFLEGGGRLSIVAPNFPRFAIVGGALAGVAIDYAPSVTAIEPDAGLVALCSPCNPSTDELDASAVRAAIAGHPQLLFCLDAAFSWYATWDPVDLVRQFDNVLVLKSYSKIGLAGLRLGYVVARPELIADLRVGRTPFGVTALCQRLGLAVEWSLDRVAWIRDEISRESEWLRDEFGTAMIHGSKVPFYNLRVSGDSAGAVDALAGRGVSVVDASRFNGMPSGRLRVAIGSREQNESFAAIVHDLRLLG